MTVLVPFSKRNMCPLIIWCCAVVLRMTMPEMLFLVEISTHCSAMWVNCAVHDCGHQTPRSPVISEVVIYLFAFPNFTHPLGSLLLSATHLPSFGIHLWYSGGPTSLPHLPFALHVMLMPISGSPFHPGCQQFGFVSEPTLSSSHLLTLLARWGNSYLFIYSYYYPHSLTAHYSAESRLPIKWINSEKYIHGIRSLTCKSDT